MKKINSFAKQLKKQAEEKVKSSTPEVSVDEYKKASSENSKLKQELAVMRKQLEGLKPEYENLVKFKTDVETKEKSTKINSELKAIAKNLKVREDAIEDVLGLVSNKFTLSAEGSVMVAGKETDNDPSEFLSGFLKGKDYYMESPVAAAAKIPPVVESEKKQVEQPTGGSIFGSALFKKQ